MADERLYFNEDVNITDNIYVHLYGDGVDEMYFALMSENIKKELFLFKKSSLAGALGLEPSTK